MPASNYHINLEFANSIWTPTARRNGTAHSGGTSVTIPWVENSNSGTGDVNSSNLKTALIVAACALFNSYVAAAPASRYSISLINNGSGIYTPTTAKDATAASGGTALTVSPVENANSGTGDTTSSNIRTAFMAAMIAVINDLANGN